MIDSPCSVPKWLRVLLPLETPRQQAACQRHDEHYEVGGERRARLAGDLAFGLDLLGADPEFLAALLDELLSRPPVDGAMDADRAEKYLWGVRLYGAPHWKGDDGPGALPPPEPLRIEAT